MTQISFVSALLIDVLDIRSAGSFCLRQASLITCVQPNARTIFRGASRTSALQWHVTLVNREYCYQCTQESEKIPFQLTLKDLLNLTNPAERIPLLLYVN